MCMHWRLIFYFTFLRHFLHLAASFSASTSGFFGVIVLAAVTSATWLVCAAASLLSVIPAKPLAPQFFFFFVFFCSEDSRVPHVVCSRARMLSITFIAASVALNLWSFAKVLGKKKSVVHQATWAGAAGNVLLYYRHHHHWCVPLLSFFASTGKATRAWSTGAVAQRNRASFTCKTGVRSFSLRFVFYVLVSLTLFPSFRLIYIFPFTKKKKRTLLTAQFVHFLLTLYYFIRQVYRSLPKL